MCSTNSNSTYKLSNGGKHVVNKMDMTLEEYLEYQSHLLQQAEADGFELEEKMEDSET
jgi:hypothetical protein